MKKKFIFILFLFLILLSSCSKVDNEVKYVAVPDRSPDPAPEFALRYIRAFAILQIVAWTVAVWLKR